MIYYFRWDTEVTMTVNGHSLHRKSHDSDNMVYVVCTYIPLAIIQINGSLLKSQIRLFKVFSKKS